MSLKASANIFLFSRFSDFVIFSYSKMPPSWNFPIVQRLSWLKQLRCQGLPEVLEHAVDFYRCASLFACSACCQPKANHRRKQVKKSKQYHQENHVKFVMVMCMMLMVYYSMNGGQSCCFGVSARHQMVSPLNSTFP